MSEERRTAPREARNTKVNFELRFTDDQGKPIKVNCHSLDISRGGLRVSLEHPLPIGFITELCAENRKGKLMLLFAEVRWCDKDNDVYQCGFQLLDAEASDLTHWLQDTSGD